MTNELKELIEIDARRAAKAGVTPALGCPYRFKSAEGIHWLAVYFLNLEKK